MVFEKLSHILEELIKSLEGSSPTVPRAAWVRDSGTGGATRPPPNNGIAEFDTFAGKGSCESRCETRRTSAARHSHT